MQKTITSVLRAIWTLLYSSGENENKWSSYFLLVFKSDKHWFVNLVTIPNSGFQSVKHYFS